MEFWGVEIKPGVPVKVKPDEGRLVHVSQAALGEVKSGKGVESVTLWLKIDKKDLVLGILSLERNPVVSFDLVFEREFELYHDWKYGSVYLCGYQADDPSEPVSDDEAEDDEPLDVENGKFVPLIKKLNPVKSTGDVKPEREPAKPKLPAGEEGADSDSEDSDDLADTDDLEDDSDDSEGDSDDMDDSNDSEDESEEEEETPKKPESTKKRPGESAIKTPSAKKANIGTPQKTDGKKGDVHTATPHPAKKAEKTPAASVGFSCKSCSKTFTSDKALESHSKAKHGGK